MCKISSSEGRTISKTSASSTAGFPNTRKLMKALGRRPSAFIVFECLGTVMKHDASQSLLRNKSKWKYSHDDLSIRKGCHQGYLNAVDNYKIKV